MGILGPNGSGKTTLLRLLAGCSRLSRVASFSTASTCRRYGAARCRKRMAWCRRRHSSHSNTPCSKWPSMGRYPHLGAFEIEGPDEISRSRATPCARPAHCICSRASSTRSRAERNSASLSQARSRSSRKGSGGVFRGQVGKPLPTPFFRFLLLDEPTASLDLAYQLEIRSILATLNRDRELTIVVSTHDLNFAASLCRELVLLHRGRVLAAGPTETMLDATLIRQLYGVDVDITSECENGTAHRCSRRTGARRAAVMSVGRRIAVTWLLFGAGAVLMCLVAPLVGSTSRSISRACSTRRSRSRKTPTRKFSSSRVCRACSPARWSVRHWPRLASCCRRCSQPARDAVYARRVRRSGAGRDAGADAEPVRPASPGSRRCRLPASQARWAPSDRLRAGARAAPAACRPMCCCLPA